MTSFLARTFSVVADKPETICAVLGTSREIMNSSAVPVTLSTDETCDLLCSKQPKNEQKLLQLFSVFSDTMQFTEQLRIHNSGLEKDFVRSILENLIKTKRYFSRTIRLLQLPSADALIEACSSNHSSTTPVLFSNLRSLSIEARDTLQSEELKAICLHCPFLENLKIPGQYQLTDEGVEFLSNLKHLKTLDSQSCGLITDAGLEHLAKISSLQSLNLGSCINITDKGLQHLVILSSLQSLNFFNCDKITDTGLEHLAKLSYLQSLNLTLCDEITDTGLEHLAKLSSLQVLELPGCDKITDIGLEHLAKLSSLESLDLALCNKITDSGLQYLAKLSCLRSLNLNSCDKITDDGLQHLAKLLSLESLNLDSCDKITDSGLEHRGKLSSLQTLGLGLKV